LCNEAGRCKESNERTSESREKKNCQKNIQVWRDVVWVDPSEGRQLLSRALPTLRSLKKKFAKLEIR